MGEKKGCVIVAYNFRRFLLKAHNLASCIYTLTRAHLAFFDLICCFTRLLLLLRKFADNDFPAALAAIKYGGLVKLGKNLISRPAQERQ